MENIELLPCPFCGSNDLILDDYPDGKYDCYVLCDNCNCCGPASDYGYNEYDCNDTPMPDRKIVQKKAYELWNERVKKT